MRLGWADVARGAAMILVVLAHVLQLMTVYGWDIGWLSTANIFLTAIRMPLFFLISGVFAANAIRRTWPDLLRSRLVLLAYMYFLWMLIRAVWFVFVPWPLGETHPWVAFLLSPVWPTNGLWFLFALVVYIVIGRLTVRLPAWIPLVAAGLIAVAASLDVIPTGGNGVWRSIALYAFFFLLGARLPGVWKTVAARANILWLIVALIAIPASVVLVSVLPGAGVSIARVGLSMVCVVASIVIAAMIAKMRRVSAPFEFVGQRTLPIYVTHAMLLAVVVPLVPPGIVPALVAALAFVAFGVGIPLALYRWLGPIGGIYNLPKPLARRLARRKAD